MTHAAAFLRAILERPGDDALRLIYADWLDECGDPRGEFIRVQCERVKLEAYVQEWASVPGRAEDGARAGAALAVAQAHERRELAILQSPAGTHFRPDACYGFPCTIGFRRGFVASIELSTADFMQHAGALFAAAPLEDVRLSDKHPFGNNPCMWLVGSANHVYVRNPARLPRDLGFCLTMIPGVYPDRAAAFTALSHACVAFGRAAAGLPPLP